QSHPAGTARRESTAASFPANSGAQGTLGKVRYNHWHRPHLIS
ncbi:hypothetical protein JMJ77_0008037, partial [Colletotrichum scovillei]